MLPADADMFAKHLQLKTTDKRSQPVTLTNHAIFALRCFKGLSVRPSQLDGLGGRSLQLKPTVASPHSMWSTARMGGPGFNAPTGH